MRKIIPWLILDALFLIVFNVCFFLLRGDADELPPSVWVSYAFIHIAYVLLLCTPLMVRGGNKAVADYRRPLYVGTWTYFVVALVVNLVFILVPLNSVLAAWIVNVMLLAAAGVYLLVNIIANNHTAGLQERHEAEARFVDSTAPRLKYLVDNAKSRSSEAALEKVYYALKSSPLRSCNEARNDEMEIIYLVGTLEETADEKEISALCDKLSRLIQRRNRIVKDNN